MSFDYPKDVRFRCIKCGICCRNTKERIRHILLQDSDVERIAVTARKSVEEFAKEIAGHEPYVYELRKTEEQGKCVFLEDEQCTIYSARPLICRFYPFELRIARNGRREFLYTTECPGIGKGKKLTGNYFRKLLRQLEVQGSLQEEIKEKRKVSLLRSRGV